MFRVNVPYFFTAATCLLNYEIQLFDVPKASRGLADRSRPVGFEPARNGIGLGIIPDDTRGRDDLLHGNVRYATTRIEYVDVGQWLKDVSLHSAAQNVPDVRCEPQAEEQCYQRLDQRLPERYPIARPGR
jgi:hypothetical protein